MCLSEHFAGNFTDQQIAAAFLQPARQPVQASWIEQVARSPSDFLDYCGGFVRWLLDQHLHSTPPNGV